MPECVCDAPAALRWVHSTFGDCVTTHAAAASFALGVVSIACTFATQAPQVVKNWRHGAAAATALSPVLLAGWLFGDSCNLSGALLARQLPTQIVSAAFLLFMDCVLLAQFLFYAARQRARRSADTVPCASSGARGALLASCAASSPAVAAAAYTGEARPRCGGEPLRLLPWRHGARAKVGYALGCAAAVAFLSGGVAQVAKDRRRRSVQGVSLLMMGTALLMNTTYALSVLLRLRSGADLAASAPWIVGSAGAGALNVVVLAQARHYSRARRRERQQALTQAAPAAGELV